MTKVWHEAPAEKIDRLTRERADYCALWRDARAKLSEARRTWARAVCAIWAVALTNVGVILALLALLGEAR